MKSPKEQNLKNHKDLKEEARKQGVTTKILKTT